MLTQLVHPSEGLEGETINQRRKSAASLHLLVYIDCKDRRKRESEILGWGIDIRCNIKIKMILISVM